MRACTGCGAPAEGERCHYCGESVAHAPELAGSVPAAGELPCPRCEGGPPLRAYGVGGITIDACSGCGGLWFDRGELEAIVERLPASAAATAEPVTPPSQPVRYLACPRCRQHMARKNFEQVSGIIIDACQEHGAWLDAGELEAIGAFHARSGGADVARSRAVLEADRARDRARIGGGVESDFRRLLRDVGRVWL